MIFAASSRNSRRHEPHRAAIPPLAPENGGSQRPRWSVMIPTYNCAGFLHQCLKSVLDQDPGAADMQIEVVDDCSTDADPGAIARQLGGRRVACYRHPANRGHINNFNTCIRRARGELVHILHGDDYVCNGFYARMQSAFASTPTPGAAFCRQIFVDGAGSELSRSRPEQQSGGLLPNALLRLSEEQRIMTPSIVVRRAVYEHLGGFDDRLVCAEDWEMWVRIAAHYPIWYEPGALAVYRMHDDSNTGRHIGSAADIRYTRAAIDIFRDYLPHSDARRIAAKAKQTYALAAIDMAGRLLSAKEYRAALAQLLAALRCRVSATVVRQALTVAATRLFPVAGKSRRTLY